MTCELLSCYGGGRGIRTPATLSRPVGFQDRSLQPDLGIPPYQQYRLYRNIIILSIIYLNFFIYDLWQVFAFVHPEHPQLHPFDF